MNQIARNYILMKLINFILIIVLLSACSSEDKHESNKYYSSNTEDLFARIENTDLKKKNPSEVKVKKIEPIKTTEPMPIKKVYKVVNNQFLIETNKDGNTDHVIELNQNLAFYCMKGTRLARFKTEKDCQNFVQSSLDFCEKRFQVVNRGMIKCLKNKLNIK